MRDTLLHDGAVPPDGASGDSALQGALSQGASQHGSASPLGEPVRVKAVRFALDAGFSEIEDEVTAETPLTVYINGTEFATVVCSPWELRYMAVGFLCSEGIVRSRAALGDLAVDAEKGIVHAKVDGFEEGIAGKVFLKRYINSCCGRSRASFYYSTDAMLCKRVEGSARITPERALELMELVMNRSAMFKRTGGVHGGLIADANGVLSFHEDVGRNNVLDRIYGRCFLEGVDLSDKVVAFSGRVSSEIVLKMSKMGVPVLVSHAAPTNLGLELADDLGITVIAFARDGQRCTVYSHPERVLGL